MKLSVEASLSTNIYLKGLYVRFKTAKDTTIISELKEYSSIKWDRQTHDSGRVWKESYEML